MLNIIKKEVREYFRNPASVFMTDLFPCLLIFILGTMLQFIDVADYEIGEIKLQYLISDSDTADSVAFETFLSEMSEIKAEKAADEATALSLTDSGEINAYVKLESGEIKLYTGDNRVVNRALGSMFNSYIKMSDTYKQIAKTNPEALMELMNEDMSVKSFVEQSGLGVTRSMIDYYAVAIIVMMLFMSCITGNSENFKDELKNHTLAKISISSVSRTSVFLGKIIGTFPMAMITVAFTMLCSSLFFGAHYCSDFLGNAMLILMLFSVAIALNALGMLLGVVMKIPAASVIMPLCWTMLFFSGSFSKEIFIEGFSNKLPPYLIQQAAFDLTLFGEYTQAVIVTAISLGLFALLTVLGAVAFSKKKVV